jgi:hypothetical protein
MSSERGWGSGERWESSGRWQNEPDRWRSDEERWRERGDYGRGDYDRWSGSRGREEEPRYGYGYGTSERWARPESHGGSRPEMRGDEWRWRSSSETRGIYEDDSGRVHSFSHWPDAGSYAGRGPKGYRRSDDRIREDICDRLTDDPHVDASEMEVAVQNGEVMLSGAVRSREDKRRAEDLAENIPGVREVHNNLRVGRWDDTASSGRTAATSGSMQGTATGAQPSSRR